MNKRDAQNNAPSHVHKKDCFITKTGGRENTYEAIEGTGCAHYVAHVLGIKGGTQGTTACWEGYTIRVRDLVKGMPPTSVSDLSLNDIWTNTRKSHCGLVTTIQPDAQGNRKIEITHCSSEQGGVVKNDWQTDFSGQGEFFKPNSGGKTALKVIKGADNIESGLYAEPKAFS